MSDQEKQEKVEMAALKMPKECLGFLRRNPTVATKVGKLMVMLFDIKQSVKNGQALVDSLETLLTKPEFFKGLLQDGTEEELKTFLDACKVAQNTEGSVIHAKNLPPEAFERIKEQMGEHMLATNIEAVEQKEEVPNS